MRSLCPHSQRVESTKMQIHRASPLVRFLTTQCPLCHARSSSLCRRPLLADSRETRPRAFVEEICSSHWPPAEKRAVLAVVCPACAQTIQGGTRLPPTLPPLSQSPRWADGPYPALGATAVTSHLAALSSLHARPQARNAKRKEEKENTREGASPSLGARPPASRTPLEGRRIQEPARDQGAARPIRRHGSMEAREQPIPRAVACIHVTRA